MSDEPNPSGGLKDLLRLLAQTEGGLAQHVYPSLRVGDVWWIPDAETGLTKEKHPWVIVRPYSPGRPTVAACLRTTSFHNADRALGIVTPANILDTLNKEGLILLARRRTFNADDFQNYQYIDRLPEQWILKIEAFYAGKAI